MIDLHTYILPEMENGPKSQDELLQVADALVKQGVTKVVVTPKYEGPASSCTSALEFANEYLRKASISLTILPGQKVTATNHMTLFNQDFYKMTINENEKYMFLEIPQGMEIEVVENIAYELQLKRVVPVLNEPERHPLFIDNPANLYTLVKNGAVAQLSAQSVLGGNGGKSKKGLISSLITD